MYKCQVCKQSAPPHQPCIKIMVYRPDGSILKEVRLCPKCAKLLEAMRKRQSA